jgi:hypothetical protein
MQLQGIRSWMLALAVAMVIGAAPTLAEESTPATEESPPATEPTPAPAPRETPAVKRQGGRPLGFLVRMGLEGGGDKLVTVEWEDGDKQDITAGGLLTFSGGLLYHPDAPYAIEATIGYKFDRVNGSNGKIQFTRVPLDMVVSWARSGHRLGVGGTMHLSPTFTCEVDGMCDGSVSYDDAFGTSCSTRTAEDGITAGRSAPAPRSSSTRATACQSRTEPASA